MILPLVIGVLKGVVLSYKDVSHKTTTIHRFSDHRRLATVSTPIVG
jgi:hypothetical protein